MALRDTETEVVRTYEIPPQLSVRLVEIPRRSHFPRCSSCGDGNYWHVTWPTAVLLAHYLATPARRRILAGRRVLVIGCGAGLEAIVLAKLGAVVSVLDHIPAALDLVARNCVLNQLDSVTTHVCCWQDEHALRHLPAYEVVIGSDILYDAIAAHGVARLLTATVQPKGTATVADPVRTFSDGPDTFVRLMTQQGFQLTSRWVRAFAFARNRRAKVYTLTAPATIRQRRRA
jgi:predicted nicotinamide N-methyase